MSTTGTQILVSNTISHEKEPVVFGEMADSGEEQDRNKTKQVKKVF